MIPTVTKTIKYKGTSYSYSCLQIVLRADKGPMPRAIAEMKRLGLTPQQYVRMVLAERVGDTNTIKKATR